jgi:homoserine trans-succinylase
MNVATIILRMFTKKNHNDMKTFLYTWIKAHGIFSKVKYNVFIYMYVPIKSLQWQNFTYWTTFMGYWSDMNFLDSGNES